MNLIGIVGTGIMGTDIAQIVATAGFNVILYDIDEEKTKMSFNTIQQRLHKYVEEGRINNNQVGEITSKIRFHPSLRDFANVDFVIECASEDIKIKKDIFKSLDKICKPGTIFATNTSSISITKIASATKRSDSVIGLHFMIPARVMKLVEIIPGLSTSRETVEMAKIFLKKLGKKYVESKDFPGFLLNRMLLPMINEAIYLLYEGAGTVESIDKVVKLGLNLPNGPLKLADMIGLDIILAVDEEMFNGYSDSKYRPCPLLRQYVAAGFLGEKSGKGFYLY